jgi:predicted nucleic acid-binding protein
VKQIILDTGAWLLAAAGIEPYAAAVAESDEWIVPGLVLAEVDHHLRRRRRDFYRLLREVETGAYSYEPPTLDDLTRAAEIDRKFNQLSLGLVDSSIAALAERLGVHRLLTIDSDFASVRIGRRWERPLELVVPTQRRER